MITQNMLPKRCAIEWTHHGAMNQTTKLGSISEEQKHDRSLTRCSQRAESIQGHQEQHLSDLILRMFYHEYCTSC